MTEIAATWRRATIDRVIAVANFTVTDHQPVKLSDESGPDAGPTGS
jgi:hypothetical protein